MLKDVNYDSLIPNNVDLAADAKLRRAMEQWYPKYLEWWNCMGPHGYQTVDVYLRTAVSVDQEGGLSSAT